MSDVSRLDRRVAVVIPARDESARIAETVRAAKAIPYVDLVLVVDDGSSDDTQDVARNAGATVVRHSHNRGRAAALETGAAVVAMRDVPDHPSRALLFLDAGLAGTAVNCAPLVEPVLLGEVDVAIALAPLGQRGIGYVGQVARDGIQRLTGWVPSQPLASRRCLTREAFEEATPLARGAGLEVGMTIDLLRAGRKFREIPCDLKSPRYSRGLVGRMQRSREVREIRMVLLSRGLAGLSGKLGGLLSKPDPKRRRLPQ
jgi:hypothetical protein